MLDQDTKRRIDSARQILVGKVPDPKAQVEQITTALIYKFMDDMDRENEELGSKAKFITGKLKQYAWGRLLSRELSGQERMLLYMDALTEFSKSEQIPELFRTIFKGTFLPYRDPETLNLFLKEINGFIYDHSEQLGNAYEYLLSILGSQGDAGQFRTPRHIIDFIVEVVNPQKTDKILDPACGTAGFLISAYKHIWRENSSNYKADEFLPGFAKKEAKDIALVEMQSNGKYKGDKLTPATRKKLGQNIIGYDISPDMVRLSLVNMYLHGFNTPKILEYDSLTYEDRWGEMFDIILANPPFMSPKGGIRPHKRFQIQANRSELLFVDYIAEHLTLKGRSGVIVPEGIIFQSSNAYKNLRKMLLEENYLWAVVSLPAGVFKPYSGVKTSILFLDRERAKKTDEILFVKVANDGFDLGDQRRAINRNDLPDAYRILQAWQNGNKEENPLAHWVNKKEILESGDYNLTGDRYCESADYSNVVWPIVLFTDICTLEYGASLPKKKRKKGIIPVVGSNGITGWHDVFLVKGPAIIVGRKGSAGEVVWIEKDCFPIDTTYYVKLQSSDYNLKFLYYVLKSLNLSTLRGGAGIPGLNRTDVYQRFKLPLPPLEVQKEIVAELDGYQTVIDGARLVVENWKPTIKINPAWEMVTLDDVADFIRGPFGGSLKKDIFVEKGIKVYEQKHAIRNDFTIGTYYITPQKFEEMRRFELLAGDLIISCSGTMGRIAIVPYDIERGIINQALLKLTPKKKLISADYIRLILGTPIVQDKYFSNTSGAAIQNVSSVKYLKTIPVPLPSLAVQKRIINEMESEKQAVESVKKLISIHEKKVKKTIAEVWGE